MTSIEPRLNASRRRCIIRMFFLINGMGLGRDASLPSGAWGEAPRFSKNQLFQDAIRVGLDSNLWFLEHPWRR